MKIFGNGKRRFYSFMEFYVIQLKYQDHSTTLTCREMWENITRDKLGVGMIEQQSQNLILKVDPLSNIRNNKLNSQGEKHETLAKLRVFVSNISSLPFQLKRRYTRYGFLFLVFRRL